MNDIALYQALLAQLTAELKTLPDKPEETADSTLRALWHTAHGAPKSAELASVTELPVLSEFGEAALRALMKKRVTGVPLSHLTERQRFMGLEMLAGPAALIPRKETELLARNAIEVALQMVKERGEIVVVDVCTGSGNVALALAHYVPGARIYAADISGAAVELARRNASHLGLEGEVEFFVGDLLAPFDSEKFHGAVDLLACNPPYIKSATVQQMSSEIFGHEPSLAFDGGAFGVAIMLRFVHEAPRFLRKNGFLLSEVGKGQAPMLAKLLEKNDAFREVRAISDEANVERVVLARC